LSSFEISIASFKWAFFLGLVDRHLPEELRMSSEECFEAYVNDDLDYWNMYRELSYLVATIEPEPSVQNSPRVGIVGYGKKTDLVMVCSDSGSMGVTTACALCDAGYPVIMSNYELGTDTHKRIAEAMTALVEPMAVEYVRVPPMSDYAVLRMRDKIKDWEEGKVKRSWKHKRRR
jgi:hypothetical protein